MVKLKTNLDWAKASAQLVQSPAWPILKERTDQLLTEVGRQLVLMQVEPSQMQIVAERAKSRADWFQEIESEAKRAESIELKYDTFLKAHNS